MTNYDVISHVKGESKFLDDMLTPEGTLYASIYYSKIAYSRGEPDWRNCS
ncbi:MAG: hypothetical protein P8X73_12105 [Ignavibacteriaceae bacterium]